MIEWLRQHATDLGALALGFFIAAFFGLLRLGHEHLQTPAETRPKFAWLPVLVKIGTAGGVGLLTTFLMLEWAVGPYLSGFLVAIAGWGGVETLNVLKEAGHETLRRYANARAPKDQ